MQAEVYEDYAPPSRPLRWYQVWWLVYTHPSAATFDRIITDPAASIRRALAWIFLTTVGLGAIQIIISWVIMPAFMRDIAGTVLLPSLILVPVNGVITMIVLAIAAGIWHILARIFGGRGWLATILGPYLVFPFLLIPVALVPPLATIVQFVAFVYPLVLIGLALKSVYRLSNRRAAAVVLTPVLVMGALWLCLFVTVFSQVGPIFQTLSATLQAMTPVEIPATASAGHLKEDYS